MTPFQLVRWSNKVRIASSRRKNTSLRRTRRKKEQLEGKELASLFVKLSNAYNKLWRKPTYKEKVTSRKDCQWQNELEFYE